MQAISQQRKSVNANTASKSGVSCIGSTQVVQVRIYAETSLCPIKALLNFQMQENRGKNNVDELKHNARIPSLLWERTRYLSRIGIPSLLLLCWGPLY